MNYATKNNRRRLANSAYQPGFTLIEVMVGVAIFAVLSALVVSSIQGNSDRNAKLEAQRFIAVVNEVRDEAVISGKTFTLSVDEGNVSYGFNVHGGQPAARGASDVLLRTRRAHESVKLKWEVFEELNDDDEDLDDLDEESAEIELAPQVFISPLGEITPFKARFGGDDDDFIVELNDDGVLAMDIRPTNFY